MTLQEEAGAWVKKTSYSQRYNLKAGDVIQVSNPSKNMSGAQKKTIL